MMGSGASMEQTGCSIVYRILQRLFHSLETHKGLEGTVNMTMVDVCCEEMNDLLSAGVDVAADQQSYNIAEEGATRKQVNNAQVRLVRCMSTLH